MKELATLDAADEMVRLVDSGTLTVEQLAELVTTSLVAQNAVARLRAHALKALQGKLFDGDEFTVADTEERLAAVGWKPGDIERARRFDQLELAGIDEYFATATVAAKEATLSGVRKLMPTQPREDRKNVADAFVVPPIDTQIARQFGLEASDIRADLIAGAVCEALTTVTNPRYAYAWVKYHGIDTEGQIGESWTFGGIAAQLGTTREYAETLYLRGSNHVRGMIAIRALEALARVM